MFVDIILSTYGGFTFTFSIFTFSQHRRTEAEKKERSGFRSDNHSIRGQLNK
jgi:hypothetical protein